MIASVTLFTSESEAAQEALALASNGWQTLITGPLEQTDVWQGSRYVAGYSGVWLLLASQAQIQIGN